MGMKISTAVFPLRVSMKRKEPWELTVEIENPDTGDKKVSVQISLPDCSTFSTVGISRAYEKRLDSFGAGEKFSVKLPVYQSSRAREGNYLGKAAVSEHFHDYDYVEKSFSKEIPFRIVRD